MHAIADVAADISLSLDAAAADVADAMPLRYAIDMPLLH